jgi:hypothetical protein
LTSSRNPATFGTPVTFKAIVTSPMGTPTGTVTFMDGTTVLGTANVNAAGKAFFTITGLSRGTHIITAVYTGTYPYLSSVSTQFIEVVT